MADRRLDERLQPSLLDRLTDDRPGEASEVRDDRVIDTRRLRDILRRDLAWLLNCTNLEAEVAPGLRGGDTPEDGTGNQTAFIDTERFPQAAKSVLNYGVRPVSGRFATARRAAEIRDAIAEAISLFEPRVRPGTLTVLLRASEHSRDTLITFDIRADMWAQPLPLDLYLRSEVDLTTGDLSLEVTG